MKTLFTAFAFCCANICSAQLTEQFSDGDFTANPPWTGNAADFFVNMSKELQSQNAVANASFYLSANSAAFDLTEWQFSIRMEFNPSSANYIDVWLAASEPNLLSATVSGYFVRLGNTNDEIALYKKAGITVSKIIDGADGILNQSMNQLRIKVSRDATGLFTLRRSANSGASYVTEGTVFEAGNFSSVAFGILIKQSTTSFFQKHFFDDISIQPYVPDNTPPVLASASVIDSADLKLNFNEPVDAIAATTTANYAVAGVSPFSATQSASDQTEITLKFANAFPKRQNLTVNAINISDQSGNIAANNAATFVRYVPLAFDVIINELMPDPTPAGVLPDYEWIELKNTTPFTINLAGWKVAKLTSESGALPPFMLKPDSVVCISSASGAVALGIWAQTLAVSSFPALSNDGDVIALKAPGGLTVHGLEYSDEWYQNALKKQGGWSLEMIDSKYPCTGKSNFRASVHTNQATPGKANSIAKSNIDDTAPKLLHAFAEDSVTVLVHFDEPADSTAAAATGIYSIDHGIGSPAAAKPVAPLFNSVRLTLATALTRNKIYELRAIFTDCAGNAAGANNKTKLGLSETPDTGDIVINEILFNPKNDGVDYVEFFNPGKKILNLKSIFIANRNATGQVNPPIPSSDESRSLFPGEYVCISESPEVIMKQFSTPDLFALISIQNLPSFNDDTGNVVLLNGSGKIIDELGYDEHWHFALISEREGISLERISASEKTVKQNFHSAAASSGYGTPGYKNSQFRPEEDLPGTVTVSPKIISPNNDGRDDYAFIEYEFPEAGYTLNVSVFDAAGRSINYAVASAICGIKGKYRWECFGNTGQVLPTGKYYLFAEAFNLNGKKKRFVIPVVVVR